MSRRASLRFIAKERLKAMGVKKVNRHMSDGGKMTHTFEQNCKRHYIGQKWLEKIREKHVPLWRRVIFGNLAKRGALAQLEKGVRA